MLKELFSPRVLWSRATCSFVQYQRQRQQASAETFLHRLIKPRALPFLSESRFPRSVALRRGEAQRHRAGWHVEQATWHLYACQPPRLASYGLNNRAVTVYRARATCRLYQAPDLLVLAGTPDVGALMIRDLSRLISLAQTLAQCSATASETCLNLGWHLSPRGDGSFTVAGTVYVS